jgi:hypothetical protein
MLVEKTYNATVAKWIQFETFLKETCEKCSFLFKFKEDENFNRRNTWGILRIKI